MGYTTTVVSSDNLNCMSCATYIKVPIHVEYLINSGIQNHLLPVFATRPFWTSKDVPDQIDEDSSGHR